MLIINPNQIKLCRQGSCCPIVDRVSEDEFTITDDFEGKVTLTKDHLIMLKEAIEEFQK
jgi:hypothetical protein